MGYERKSLQILGGSFNLLTSPDKVPITDYLLAQNWRVDSLGRLVSRSGYTQLFSIAGAGIAHSASDYGGSASALYVGCNSNLTTPTSAVYYDSDTTPIATGFDGNRIAFAAQNGFMWIMNRGKQVRHSVGAGTEMWNLIRPGASCSAAAVAGSGGAADVTFTYTATGTGTTVHTLTIAGITYSIAENAFAPFTPLLTSDEICWYLAAYAASDINCAVTYSGSGNTVLITAVVPNVGISVSGSDSNTTTLLANGVITSLPNGTYQYYTTFLSTDLSLESNPGPASNAVVLAGEAASLTGIPVSSDARVGSRNIYATGGTLGSPYLVGNIPDNSTTAFTVTTPDLQATNNGIVMPTTNDPPPAAAGMIGPHFSRLYAWSTAANPGRLFYTNPNLPQYWPGAVDPAVGNWVDVGLAGEAIVWCTIHTNMLVIYKERSIWMLLGDPATGTLYQVYDGCGLSGQWAVTPAGMIDYFVGPNNLYVFDMNAVHQIGGAILPIFNQNLSNGGNLTPPGAILGGTAVNSSSTAQYAVFLGHAFGRLFISYAEQHALGGASWNLLVYNEGPQPETNVYVASSPGKWFYHRNAISGIIGFLGFFFDGLYMIGLTGATGGAAQGFALEDFSRSLTEDIGSVPIQSTYQSHFEDAGQPNQNKTWLEVAIDYEFAVGTSATVYAGYNVSGAVTYTSIGTITGSGVGIRVTKNFTLSQTEALNVSIIVDVSSTLTAVLYNVYLFYYLEERWALVASTLPTDLGVGKVKQCKELELDVSSPNGTVGVIVASDLPGNAIASRHTPTVAQNGRAIFKYPFAITEGLLWQLTLTGVSSNTFQLYAARLLMRIMEIYVEGYESTAGFVWDSMQQDLGSPEAKTFDQIRFDMEAGGASSVTMLTDLPGEAFATRGGGAFALTSASTSRAWVTVPLPDPYGASAIEGRSVQLQVTGNTGFKIYKAQVRFNKIGRYLMGTAPDSNNDALQTLEFDFNSERVKQFKRIEVDLRANGTVTMKVITNQAGTLATGYSPTITTTGRQAIMVPLIPGLRGRLLRLQLSSPAAARIYHIRVWTQPLNEPKAGWKWEDFPLEASDVVPTWHDLIAEETSPIWKWVDVPMNVVEG